MKYTDVYQRQACGSGQCFVYKQKNAPKTCKQQIKMLQNIKYQWTPRKEEHTYQPTYTKA